MRDIPTLINGLLTGNAPLIALVPATRIFWQWPSSFTTLPVVAFRVSNQRTTDQDYYDNTPFSELIDIDIHVFTGPDASPTAIAQAVNTVLVADRWNLDYSEDNIESDTGNVHWIGRYSKRLV